MASRNPARPRSGWSAVRMWQQDLAQSLQRRHALRLHEALPGSRLALVDGAGHSPFDPPLTQALLDALAHFATHRSFERWPAR